MALSETEMKRRKELPHMERMERLFQRVAYWSLFVDLAITVVTLASINIHTGSIQSLQLLLNWLLSAVLIVSIVVFLAIRFMIHYDKIIDGFARVGIVRRSGHTGRAKRGRR